jgi:hypothetical protein
MINTSLLTDFSESLRDFGNFTQAAVALSGLLVGDSNGESVEKESYTSGHAEVPAFIARCKSLWETKTPVGRQRAEELLKSEYHVTHGLEDSRNRIWQLAGEVRDFVIPPVGITVLTRGSSGNFLVDSV